MQMVKHDQKYTECYHTNKSHYSKTQTSYPNARLHIKIIYNIFPLKHPDLHIKNKCAFGWFTYLLTYLLTYLVHGAESFLIS
jgi:hypothetical protein